MAITRKTLVQASGQHAHVFCCMPRLTAISSLLQAEAIGARHAASWAAKPHEGGPAAFDPFEAAEEQVMLNPSPAAHGP